MRPTPDRVRETLFNWLGQNLSGRRCLDLFAGSGALGFEAASRGASAVVMVERDRRAWQALQRNARLLGCEAVVELRHCDALEFARTAEEAFDIVFLDPPYDSGMIRDLIPSVPRLLRSGGALYVESAEGIVLEPPLRPYRSGTAGHVTFQLFIHGDQ